MANALPANRRRPFISRKLRPDVNVGPVPPILPTAPPRAEFRRRVRQMLGPRLCQRLGVPAGRDGALAPERVFFSNPRVMTAEVEGESVLLDLRTARSFSLNPAGSLLWNRLCAGRSLRAAHTALRQRFAVSPDVAWADLVSLVSDLRREGLLRSAQPKCPTPPAGDASRSPMAAAGRKAARTDGPRPPGSAPGLFALHAVGLEKGGCGFLIAAASAWQQTPACRALIRAGYRPFSGQTPVLRERVAGLELLPIARTSKSAPSSHTPGAAPAPPCRPAFLLFPQTVDWPLSSIEPLRGSRALEELLPLTLVLRSRRLAPREFRLLARLVETAECYRLHCGEDVSALPALFDGRLTRWTGSQKTTKETKKLG